MELLDWAIFLIYLVFVFAIGVWVSKKSGEGINSYFVADRSLPWWWLGISIIATTFAADTPLAITGITASSGIAGNWLWWSWAATYITVSVFFAKRWRMSNVLTDVEFIELRYSGKEAAFLRGFKAFFYGVILNVFISKLEQSCNCDFLSSPITTIPFCCFAQCNKNKKPFPYILSCKSFCKRKS